MKNLQGKAPKMGNVTAEGSNRKSSTSGYPARSRKRSYTESRSYSQEGVSAKSKDKKKVLPMSKNNNEKVSGTKRKITQQADNKEEANHVTPKKGRSSKGFSESPGLQKPLTERQQLAYLLEMTARESMEENAVSEDSKIGGTDESDRKSQKTEKKAMSKLNKRNERGETQMHLMAIRGDSDGIKKLISQGADVNVTDYAGWTPLHEACNRGHYKIVKVLLRAGAQVTARGLDGDTPLHDASSNGHLKIVTALLRYGGDPLLKNHHGETPLDIAGSDEVEALLENFIERNKEENESEADKENGETAGTIVTADESSRASTSSSLNTRQETKDKPTDRRDKGRRNEESGSEEDWKVNSSMLNEELKDTRKKKGKSTKVESAVKDTTEDSSTLLNHTASSARIRELETTQKENQDNDLGRHDCCKAGEDSGCNCEGSGDADVDSRNNSGKSAVAKPVKSSSTPKSVSLKSSACKTTDTKHDQLRNKKLMDKMEGSAEVNVKYEEHCPSEIRSSKCKKSLTDVEKEILHPAVKVTPEYPQQPKVLPKDCKNSDTAKKPRDRPESKVRTLESIAKSPALEKSGGLLCPSDIENNDLPDKRKEVTKRICDVIKETSIRDVKSEHDTPKKEKTIKTKVGKGRSEKEKVPKERIEREVTGKEKPGKENIKEAERQKSEKESLSRDSMEMEEVSKDGGQEEEEEKEKTEKERTKKVKVVKEIGKRRPDKESIGKEIKEKEEADKERREKERAGKEKMDKERTRKDKVIKEGEKRQPCKEDLGRENKAEDADEEKGGQAGVEKDETGKDKRTKEAEKQRPEKEGLGEERTEEEKRGKERTEKEGIEKERNPKSKALKEVEKQRLEGEGFSKQLTELEKMGKDKTKKEKTPKVKVAKETDRQRSEKEIAITEIREREKIGKDRIEKVEKERLEKGELGRGDTEKTKAEKESKEEGKTKKGVTLKGESSTDMEYKAESPKKSDSFPGSIKKVIVKMEDKRSKRRRLDISPPPNEIVAGDIDLSKNALKSQSDCKDVNVSVHVKEEATHLDFKCSSSPQQSETGDINSNVKTEEKLVIAPIQPTIQAKIAVHSKKQEARVKLENLDASEHYTVRLGESTKHLESIDSSTSVSPNETGMNILPPKIAKLTDCKEVKRTLLLTDCFETPVTSHVNERPVINGQAKIMAKSDVVSPCKARSPEKPNSEKTSIDLSPPNMKGKSDIWRKQNFKLKPDSRSQKMPRSLSMEDEKPFGPGSASLSDSIKEAKHNSIKREKGKLKRPLDDRKSTTPVADKLLQGECLASNCKRDDTICCVEDSTVAAHKLPELTVPGLKNKAELGKLPRTKLASNISALSKKVPSTPGKSAKKIDKAKANHAESKEGHSKTAFCANEINDVEGKCSSKSKSPLKSTVINHAPTVKASPKKIRENVLSNLFQYELWGINPSGKEDYKEFKKHSKVKGNVFKDQNSNANRELALSKQKTAFPTKEENGKVHKSPEKIKGRVEKQTKLKESPVKHERSMDKLKEENRKPVEGPSFRKEECADTQNAFMEVDCMKLVGKLNTGKEIKETFAALLDETLHERSKALECKSEGIEEEDKRKSKQEPIDEVLAGPSVSDTCPRSTEHKEAGLSVDVTLLSVVKPTEKIRLLKSEKTGDIKEVDATLGMRSTELAMQSSQEANDSFLKNQDACKMESIKMIDTFSSHLDGEDEMYCMKSFKLTSSEEGHDVSKAIEGSNKQDIKSEIRGLFLTCSLPNSDAGSGDNASFVSVAKDDTDKECVGIVELATKQKTGLANTNNNTSQATKRVEKIDSSCPIFPNESDTGLLVDVCEADTVNPQPLVAIVNDSLLSTAVDTLHHYEGKSLDEVITVGKDVEGKNSGNGIKTEDNEVSTTSVDLSALQALNQVNSDSVVVNKNSPCASNVVEESGSGAYVKECDTLSIWKPQTDDSDISGPVVATSNEVAPALPVDVADESIVSLPNRIVPETQFEDNNIEPIVASDLARPACHLNDSSCVDSGLPDSSSCATQECPEKKIVEIGIEIVESYSDSFDNINPDLVSPKATTSFESIEPSIMCTSKDYLADHGMNIVDLSLDNQCSEEKGQVSDSKGDQDVEKIAVPNADWKAEEVNVDDVMKENAARVQSNVITMSDVGNLATQSVSSQSLDESSPQYCSLRDSSVSCNIVSIIQAGRKEQRSPSSNSLSSTSSPQSVTRTVDLEPCDIVRSMMSTDFPDCVNSLSNESCPLPSNSSFPERDDLSTSELRIEPEVTSSGMVDDTSERQPVCKSLESDEIAEKKSEETLVVPKRRPKSPPLLSTWRQVVREKCKFLTYTNEELELLDDSLLCSGWYKLKQWPFKDNNVKANAMDDSEFELLREKHTVEVEKLHLSMEQELMRVQSRCKLLWSEKVPVSACSVLMFQEDELHKKLPEIVTSRCRVNHVEDVENLRIALINDILERYLAMEKTLLRRHQLEWEGYETNRKLWKLIRVGQRGILKQNYLKLRNLSGSHGS